MAEIALQKFFENVAVRFVPAVVRQAAPEQRGGHLVKDFLLVSCDPREGGAVAEDGGDVVGKIFKREGAHDDILVVEVDETWIVLVERLMLLMVMVLI